jgi:hypothetical protein
MNAARARAASPKWTRSDPVAWKDVDDLQTQLEALLDQVWRCEAAWRREDRVDRAIRYGSLK